MRIRYKGTDGATDWDGRNLHVGDEIVIDEDTASALRASHMAALWDFFDEPAKRRVIKPAIGSAAKGAE